MDQDTSGAEHDARSIARAVATQLVSTRLAELMADKGVRSARDLAKRSQIGLGTAGTLLRGESEPTLSTMLLIASALDLHSIEELLAPLGTELALNYVALGTEDAASSSPAA